ncbi:MAG: peptidylprolyl isomerase, partial [Bacteroidota bacterium]
MHLKFYTLFLLISVTLLLSSCRKQDNTDYLAVDIERLRQYVADNNLNATELPSGVFVVVEEEGEGELVDQCGGLVTVFYKGYLLDGTV